MRERAGYRASFDADGLRFSPRRPLFAGADHHLAYRLTVVRKGNDVVLQPGREFPVPIGEDLVRFPRGDAFAEEYLLTAAGVEQRFVFSQPITSAGDLVIEGNLTGDLQPHLSTNTGEIYFHVPGTDEVAVTYGRAIVEDASGDRIAAVLELDGAHLRIVVPGDWLETAVYPVVVDPLIGSNFAVSTQAISGNQERAAVAYGGHGQYLVAWHGAGSGDDVYAQVLSYTGALVSDTIDVDTRGSNQRYPDAAGNVGDGQYLVVWQHDGGLMGQDWDIYGRLVYSDGSSADSSIEVYAGTYDQQFPAAAFNTNDGEYLVVWREYDVSSRNYYIYGQVVEADGSLSGTRVEIQSSATLISYPDITFNISDTEYLVVWQQYSGVGIGASWDIWGRIVDEGGGGSTEAFSITAASWDQTVPAATCNVSDTEYLVVWQTYDSGTNSQDVQGARVSRTGEVRAEAGLGIATGDLEQSAPDVVYGGELHEYLVVWEQSDVASNPDYQIYGRRVNRVGQLIGDALGIYTGTADQRYPAVAYDEAEAEYTAVWQDYRSGSHWDVYAQRVAPSGSLRGEEVLASAEPADQEQQDAAVAYGTGQELHLVVWRDGRNATDDVYGQFVTGGGALVGEAFTITNQSDYDEAAPAVAYDPDDDVYLVVWARRLPPWQEDDWNIHAQRVDGDGELVGSALAVCTALDDQTAPAVA